jgi:glutamate 5-kinase
VLLVSSGAIAAGMQRLGWKTRPHAMHDLQAAAAVGQMGLAQAYETTFLDHGLKAAQILLTHDDLADRTRYLNARSTLHTLLELGVVPIINENDTVVTDEIKFGDNDTLGALVANLVEAEALIILTDQKGLYSADPRKDPAATLISEGRADDRRFEAMAGGAGSGISKGGMITKVRAAQRAAKSGAHTLIVSGREPDDSLLSRRARRGHRHPALRRRHAAGGAQAMAGRPPATGRRADARRRRGEGAGNGRSLLPSAWRGVEGDFERGAAVACHAPDGREIARGLINYSSSEARRIAGHGTQEIEALLGYIDSAELIHRDNLVLL